MQVQLSELSTDLHIFRELFKCRDTHHFFCEVIRIGFNVVLAVQDGVQIVENVLFGNSVTVDTFEFSECCV